MKIKGLLTELLEIFGKVFDKLGKLIYNIRKFFVIKSAEREISRKLNRFKREFDNFMNEYYDYLPLPQGKSIIQNTLKTGKTFYLVIFNDVRRKYAVISEVFSDPYFPLPSEYDLLQKIDITTFMEKIKENMQARLISRKNKIYS
ncbi:MAG: hypothetical protein N2712_06520 [Brevinematales bacterium]|nr:hypothetical protein [Brevinematales bacterium]